MNEEKLVEALTDAIRRVSPKVDGLREKAKTHPIEAAWESYAVLVLNDAPETVLDCSRMMFFAGAVAVFQRLCASVGSDPSVDPTEAELAAVKLVGDELEEYKRDMLRRAKFMATEPEGRA